MPATRGAGRSGGVHFLASPRIAKQLIQHCPLTGADLVVEFGAGQGAITAHLVATGARVLAVERDPQFAKKLRNRFGNEVRVIEAEAGRFPLPRTKFAVIASIPYALSTTLFRRLLSPQRTRLHKASIIVEWGFAKRLTAAVPRDLEQAWWAARFGIRLVSRVRASCFSPAPNVHSAHVALTSKRTKGDRALWTLLDTAYRTPSRSARSVVAATGKNPHRALRGAGIDPAQPSGTVTPQQWSALAVQLVGDPALHWPPLPRRLR
ncbi:MAG TPA: rRNA adenine N(6)-methyltransferase family protein [Amycolatopsis sp.]|nr:rRNA adenine N(6)-methyltransferase family protein [Amycolatopsis sp.]